MRAIKGLDDGAKMTTNQKIREKFWTRVMDGHQIGYNIYLCIDGVLPDDQV